MTELLQAPTHQTRSSTSAWMALAVTTVTLVLGALLQWGVYSGLGLCMESDVANCPADTIPTAWEFALATVPTYLLWVVPSMVAALLGWKSMRTGNRSGSVATILSVVIVIAITVTCTLIWWV